jgi:hypothetical protein
LAAAKPLMHVAQGPFFSLIGMRRRGWGDPLSMHSNFYFVVIFVVSSMKEYIYIYVNPIAQL